MGRYYVHVCCTKETPRLPVGAISLDYWVEVEAIGAAEAKDKAVSAVKGIYGKFGLSGEGIFADEANGAYNACLTTRKGLDRLPTP